MIRNSQPWCWLLRLIKRDGLDTGAFSLSSGGHGSYYIDAKKITLSPEGAWLTARLVLGILEGEAIYPDAIGGPSIGAAPIAASVALLSYERNAPIPAFIVRKEPKVHGKQQLIEGPLESNSRVVIVDDVVTTGGAISRAIDAVEELGCEVMMIIALADRLEGAEERFKGYDFRTIFTRDDLMEEAT